MPSPSYLSLSMGYLSLPKGFCNTSSWLEVHAFCLSSCILLFLQQASCISPTVLAKSVSALSLCLSLQSHCWNISLPTAPRLTYPPTFLLRCVPVTSFLSCLQWSCPICLSFSVSPKQSPSLTLTCELSSTSPWLPVLLLAYLSPSLLTFSVVFLSSPSSLLTCSLFLHHLHASLLFVIQLPPITFPIPLSSQAKLQHCRDKLSRISLKRNKATYSSLNLPFRNGSITRLLFVKVFHLKHQLLKSAAKTVRASQSYEQLNTKNHTGTCCTPLTHSAICPSWNLTYIQV